MKAIFIAITLMLVTGCDAFENEQVVPQEMIGEWELTGTGFGTIPTYGVDSNHYSMTLILYADRATWYKNDEIWGKFGAGEKKKDWPNNTFFMKVRSKNLCNFKAVLNEATSTLAMIPTNCLEFRYHFFKKVSN